jgi:hypothetical protein
MNASLLGAQEIKIVLCSEYGQHLSVEDTQIKVRQAFFWDGMTADVLTFVAGCCMGKMPSGMPVPHHNPHIQSRVNKFLGYLAGRVRFVIYRAELTSF